MFELFVIIDCYEVVVDFKVVVMVVYFFCFESFSWSNCYGYNCDMCVFCFGFYFVVLIGM